MILDHYDFGVGIDFVDDEIRKQVLGDGRNLLT